MKRLYKFEPLPPNELFEQQQIIVVTASTLVSGSFDVRKQRGNVKAYTIMATSNGATTNELAKATITTSPDGKSSIENSSLLRFSEHFRLSENVIYPQEIEGGATFNYKIDNSLNANELVVSIVLYFYNPQYKVAINPNQEFSC